MNAIIGFSELLSLKKVDENQYLNYLSIIKNKSRSLLNYIDDIVELTKLENQLIEFSPTQVNLPQLFKDIYREYQNDLIKKKSNVEFFLNLSSSTEANIFYADKGRLYQILQYFIETALILTTEGYIQLGYEHKDAKTIIFFIRYSGEPLTIEQQKILFNRLWFPEDVTDTVIQQIGLRLALAKLIVKKMDGKIIIDKTDQISAFYIQFPLRKKEPEVELTDHNNISKYNWKDKVLLIAEDDEINFQFLEALLSDTQIQVIHVFNGKQAVEICHSLPRIDLILMDIKMPVKNGFEAIKEIKQITGKKIPIIAQTAYSSKTDREKCIKAGCDAYLVKPLDVDIFYKVLSQFLND